MQLLRAILDFLFPLNDTQALVASASPEILGTFARPTPVNETVVALLPYRRPVVRACVIEAKFKGNERAEDLLAGVLADYLNEWSAEQEVFSPGPLVLIPVPLSSRRLKERGHNQAERIARKAARMLSSVYLDTDILLRTRDTRPQTTLGGRARRRNLAGAFAAKGTPDPEHTYIVFDDVITTGSTLKSALSALRAAGAERVLGIALAH